MKDKPEVGDVRQIGTEALRHLLLQVLTDPKAQRLKTEAPPELIDVSSRDEELEVIVVPLRERKRVTLRLHVTSTALIPIRPRRRRRK